MRELLEVEGERKFALFTVGVRLEHRSTLVATKVGIGRDDIMGNSVTDEIRESIVEETSTAVIVGDITIRLTISVFELIH